MDTGMSGGEMGDGSANILRKFRDKGYGNKTEAAPSATPRTIKLSEEETAALAGSAQPGQEITVQVSGKLEADGSFTVMSVSGGDGMQEEMGRAMMSRAGGMMG